MRCVNDDGKKIKIDVGQFDYVLKGQSFLGLLLSMMKFDINRCITFIWTGWDSLNLLRQGWWYEEIKKKSYFIKQM